MFDGYRSVACGFWIASKLQFDWFC